MKLAIAAVVVFFLGVGPGLVKSEGPVPDSQRVHRTATAQAHPVLTKMAGLLKVRL